MAIQPETPHELAMTFNDRLFAALSYLLVPIVSILVLVLDDTKSRAYPRYHAVQSLGFMIALLVYEAFATLVFVCGSIVTFGIGSVILWVLFFLPFIPLIIYTYKAAQGELFAIPVVTRTMTQQGWLQSSETLAKRDI